MCEEESDDHEAVAKLFEINDSIHRTIERYKLIKQGDLQGANAIAKGTLGISGAGVKKGPNNELSLIDFGGPDDDASQATAAGGDDASGAPPPPPPPKGNALEDDLLGLSIGPGDAGFGSGGALSLGAPSSNGLMDLADAGPSSSSSAQQGHKPKASTSDILSQFNAPPPQSPRSNFDAFAALSNSNPASPTPNLFSQPPAPQQTHQQPAKNDPFAALSGTSRTASPFQYQQSLKQPAVAPSSPALAQIQAQTKSRPTSLISNGAGDDEWTFTSALPQQGETNVITVTNSSIQTVFHVSRPQGANDWLAVESRISNNTSQIVTDLTFQLAVTKVCRSLRLTHTTLVLIPLPFPLMNECAVLT